MKDQGTVAVVVPTCNRRQLLLQAVRSVLGQTYADLRCIVVDNGSADGTAAALAGIGDPRLARVGHDDKLGPAGARNLGIEAAAGATWVAFLDDDDLWAPAKLEVQLAALAANPRARWCGAACTYVNADLEPLLAERLRPGGFPDQAAVLVGGTELLEMFRRDNNLALSASNVLAEREMLVAVGKFDASLSLCEDWDLWLRLARVSPFAYIDFPLDVYRTWNGQASTESSESRAGLLQSTRVVRSRYLPAGDVAPTRELAASWAQHAGRLGVAEGKRLASFSAYLRAAWLGRAPGQLAYALAAATAPSLTERRLQRVEAGRQAGALPDGWETSLASWLGAYRSDGGVGQY